MGAGNGASGRFRAAALPPPDTTDDEAGLDELAVTARQRAMVAELDGSEAVRSFWWLQLARIEQARGRFTHADRQLARARDLPTARWTPLLHTVATGIAAERVMLRGEHLMARLGPTPFGDHRVIARLVGSTIAAQPGSPNQDTRELVTALAVFLAGDPASAAWFARGRAEHPPAPSGPVGNHTVVTSLLDAAVGDRNAGQALQAAARSASRREQRPLCAIVGLARGIHLLRAGDSSAAVQALSLALRHLAQGAQPGWASCAESFLEAARQAAPPTAPVPA